MLSRHRIGHNLNSFQTLSTTGTHHHGHQRQDSFEHNINNVTSGSHPPTRTSSKKGSLKKAYSRDLNTIQASNKAPIARLSSANKRSLNQTVVISDAPPAYPPQSATLATKKRSNSARKPPEPNSIKRKNSKIKENSNSRANQQQLRSQNDVDNLEIHHHQSTLTVGNDIHNFSTIVRPHHESEEDRSMPQAENDAAISGQFSIFEQ